MTSTFPDLLRAGLESADVAFEDDDGQLRIPARHHDVGDLLITFDDGEITVFVGNFTHRHFTPHEGADCVQDALDYVCGIVNDQWVLWAYPGGAGGSYRLGTEADATADAPLADEQVVRYVWSGPYDPRQGASPERSRVQ